MKKLFTFLALVVLATPAALAQSGNGNNGARVGKAGFLLNVRAFEQCPANELVGSHRHQIAVQADYTGRATGSRVNEIFLRSGPGFQVQDGNACDETGAYVQLPINAANCSNCSGPLRAPTFREYAVRARVLGKPGGRATITSCAEMMEIDPVTQAEVPTSFCSVGEENIRLAVRTTGAGKTQNRWENASAELLTVCIDTSGDGICDDRIGLFDSRGEDYWWKLDTAGRPHIQLVFFPVPPSTSPPPGTSSN